MKTVTNNFLASWLSKGSKFAVQRIDYKRRYWNGAAYVYEASWQSLTMPSAQFRSIGSMTWNIDTTLQEEFKSSNAIVSLLNNDYRWMPENTYGIFGPDAVATGGYFARGTQVIIYAGYELADGTFELVSMFAGLLIDYSMKPADGVFEAYVSGNEIKLQNNDAQLVADAFTDEVLLGTVDGANKVFTTASLGVGFITGVKIDAAVKKQGSDYTISGLNTPAVGATVTFAVAPGGGTTPKATGSKWKADQTIDALVGLVCDQAGITAGNRTIQQVLFPSGVTAKKTIDSEADWEAGTVLTNINTTDFPGSIVRGTYELFDDFSDGEYTSNPVWTATAKNAAVAGVVASCLQLTSEGATSSMTMEAALAHATGAWRFALNMLTFSSPGLTNARDGGIVGFVQNGAVTFSANAPKLTGYALRWNTNYNSGGSNQLQLVRYDNEAVGTVLANLGTFVGSHYVNYLVTRDAAGLMNVYANDVPLGSATDNTYAAGTEIVVVARDSSSQNVVVGITNIYYSTEMTFYPANGVWESAILDTLNTPTSWGTLDAVATANAGTITYATASSSDGVTFDAYVDVVGDAIVSALKRYVKVRATLTIPSIDNVSPKVDSIVVNYSSLVANVSLADFTGDTCYSAVQKLAFSCNYEIGFDNTGKFFFRSKTAGANTLTFKQSDILSKIIEVRPGWVEVINDAQVQYGAYYNEYNSLTLPETSPTSKDKFDSQISNQTVPFLFANDGNVAAGLAQAIHDAGYQAQRRVTIECRLIPQADIGDVITISFYEDPLLENNYWGDPLITWAPFFGVPPAALRLFKCRIIQLTHDFDTEKSRMVVLEVLT